MRVKGQTDSEVEATERRAKLGRVLREHRERNGIAQTDLGALLGDIPQTTVSRWERGQVELTYEQVYALEAALSLPPGTLGRATAYVASDPNPRHMSVLDLLNSDKDLHPSVRDVAVATYKGWVEVSKKLFAKDPVTHRRAAKPTAKASSNGNGRRH